MRPHPHTASDVDLPVLPAATSTAPCSTAWPAIAATEAGSTWRSLTPVFGTGTLSSSDGQRFPVRGKTLTGRDMVIHGGQVLSTYTHVTDQHTTYGTKIIVATKREAHYVLDDILGNATDVPVTEHATDTHGVTLVNFGLFDLLGLQLSPRIRDLGKITLYRTGSRAQVEAEFPHTGPLLTRKLNTDLIAEHYDDLLRVAGSLKFGHATASLLVGKLSASGRQNALAAALKEYGALRRTIYAARYLADPAYRRKISRQLNKGESLHALKRDLLYAHEGTVRARHIEAQTEQAWCLTLVTNAVVAWSTEYYGLAVDSMRAAGRRIDDEVLGAAGARPTIRWACCSAPSPEIGQHVETGCGTARLVPVTLLRPVELSHVVAGGAAARAEVAERLCTTGITTAATCPDRPSSDQARWRR